MATIEEILSWVPRDLATAGDTLAGDRLTLLDLQDEVDAGQVPETWVGDAAAAATANQRLLVDEVNDLVAEVAATEVALVDAAEAIRRAQDVLRDGLDLARRNGFQVDTERLVVTDTVDRYADEIERADRERLLGEIVDHLEQGVIAADHADQQLDDALRAVLAGVEGGSGALADAARIGEGIGDGDAVPLPDASESPAAFAAWWAALSPAQQQRIIEQHPGWIGNRDGIPAAARHQANMNRIPGLLDSLRDQQAALGPRPSDIIGGLAWDREMAAIQHKIDGIDEILDLVDETADTDYPRQVLALDITDERLEAAVAIGDIDTADNVTVFTPGLDTEIYDGLRGNDQRLFDLVNRAQAFDPTATQAAVFWLDYQAPQPLESLDLGGDSVASDNLAQEGAVDLASFLNGIDASRTEDPHLTAIGHSYGSLTTGLALQNPTGVDDAVYLGSPGIGTSDLGQTDVPDGHSYYIEADWDPVADLGRFGDDPSGMAGLDNLSADDATSLLPGSEGQPLDGVTGHTSYFEDGSTSQYNMGVIMADLDPDYLVDATEKSRLEQLGDGLSDWWRRWGPG